MALSGNTHTASTFDAHPDLVSAATRRAHGGPSYTAALAVWYLGRSVDRERPKRAIGRVDKAALAAAALAIGWNADKFYRSLRAARAHGLVDVVRRKRDGVRVVELRSLFRVARALGLDSVGHVKIVLKLSALATPKTFKAAMFAAFVASAAAAPRAKLKPKPTSNPRPVCISKPISRETLRGLTGIARRTQTRYQKIHNARRDGQVKTVRNFAVLGQGPASLAGAREYVHGACFLYGGAVVRPFPNNYRVTLLHGSRSKLVKVNRALRGPVSNGARQSTRRVFFDNAKAGDRAARKGLTEPHYFYRSKTAYHGAGVWRMTSEGLAAAAKVELQNWPI